MGYFGNLRRIYEKRIARETFVSNVMRNPINEQHVRREEKKNLIAEKQASHQTVSPVTLIASKADNFC